MESTQSLKKRLKSVDNINKITKAMELVAATKMRKAQEIAIASRPYAFAALDLLANLTLIEKSKNIPMPELLKQRDIKKVLFVLVSSDKGLAGAFNSSVFRKFEKHFKETVEQYQNEEHVYLAIGEKANQYLLRKKFPITNRFVEVGDYITPEEVQPISDFIIKGYLEEKWDRVVIVSTHFRSALKQEPHVRKILPIDFDQIKDTIKELIPQTGRFAEMIKENGISFTTGKKNTEYLIEPSIEIVMEDLTKHLFFMQIYHLILEANASEHSARRLAMKTASDNASDLSEKINLQYNKVRQANITKEIIEIVAGAEALN